MLALRAKRTEENSPPSEGRKFEMSNVAVMSIGIGVNPWIAEFDGTAGAASNVFVATSHVSNALYSNAMRLKIAWDLNRLSRKLSGMLDGLYKAMENAERSGTKKEPISREQLESAVRTLEYLYDVSSRLYSVAQQKRLTNNSMMAGSLSTIHRRSEELLDIVDWFQAAMSCAPSKLDELYAAARKDLRAGAVYDLAQVR